MAINVLAWNIKALVKPKEVKHIFPELPATSLAYMTHLFSESTLIMGIGKGLGCLIYRTRSSLLLRSRLRSSSKPKFRPRPHLHLTSMSSPVRLLSTKVHRLLWKPCITILCVSTGRWLLFLLYEPHCIMQQSWALGRICVWTNMKTSANTYTACIVKSSRELAQEESSL